MMDVKPAMVQNWVKAGLLQAIDGGGTTKPRWFQLDDDIIAKLQAAKNKQPWSRSKDATKI